jgi:hypothetical protein
VDFISEWTKQQVPKNPESREVWKMYFDGSLRLQGAGAGILFIAPKGDQLKYASQLLFPASSNTTEYEALIFYEFLILWCWFYNVIVISNMEMHDVNFIGFLYYI